MARFVSEQRNDAPFVAPSPHQLGDEREQGNRHEEHEIHEHHRSIHALQAAEEKAVVKPVHRDGPKAYEIDEYLVGELLAHRVERGPAEPTFRRDLDSQNEKGHHDRKHGIAERDRSIHWEEAREWVESHVGNS